MYQGKVNTDTISKMCRIKNLENTSYNDILQKYRFVWSFPKAKGRR